MLYVIITLSGTYVETKHFMDYPSQLKGLFFKNPYEAE